MIEEIVTRPTEEPEEENLRSKGTFVKIGTEEETHVAIEPTTAEPEPAHVTIEPKTAPDSDED